MPTYQKYHNVALSSDEKRLIDQYRADQAMIEAAAEPKSSKLEDRLPRFKCHKIVHAAQVTSIIEEMAGWTVIVKDKQGKPFAIGVSASWIQKHGAEAGGYFVCYKDGYTSWSPREAFEEGYAFMDGPDG